MSVDRAAVEARLSEFTGEIQQIPPMVSAVHHEGRRLHELAREGIVVERAARSIEIFELELLDFTAGAKPNAEIEVSCSAGTYIRTLAHDLGQILEVGAHLGSLRRIRSGAFSIDDSIPLEEAEAQARTGELAFVTMADALGDAPKVVVDPSSIPLLRNGRDLPAPEGMDGCEVVAMVTTTGELIALARERDGRLRPYKVLLD